MGKILLIIVTATLLLADIGKVTVIKGEASVERDVKVIKAHNDMGLFRQDIVETEQGRLQMLFVDNTVISLGRESRFVIKEYLYDGLDTSRAIASFKIEKGFIKTITGAIGKMMPDLFVLETSVTKIKPHGTIWSVKVDEDSEYYSVAEGKITLSFKDSKERNIELFAGESMTLEIGLNGAKKVVKSFKKSKEAKTNARYENRVEQERALVNEDMGMNQGTVVNGVGEIVSDGGFYGGFDDGNNGHGNDPGGFDPSNPGRGHGHGRFK